MVFSHALADVAKTHETLLETEWGSTDNVPFLQDQMARADRDMVPWIEWSYGPAARKFHLVYTTKRAGGHGTFRAGAITEIAVPSLVYGGRYKVHVTGGKVISRRGASPLRISSSKPATRITVTVSPR